MELGEEHALAAMMEAIESIVCVWVVRMLVRGVRRLVRQDVQGACVLRVLDEYGCVLGDDCHGEVDRDARKTVRREGTKGYSNGHGTMANEKRINVNLRETRRRVQRETIGWREREMVMVLVQRKDEKRHAI